VGWTVTDMRSRLNEDTIERLKFCVGEDGMTDKLQETLNTNYGAMA